MRIESQESRVKGKVTKKSGFLKSDSSQAPLTLATSHSQHGFSLLETLLSIAAIGILAGLSIPVFNSLQIQNDLDMATISVVENLRRAEFLSQSVEGDSEWGVKIQSGNLFLFKGASYAGRDSSYDEETSISAAITPSGDTEIVFNKLTGSLGSSKSLTLQTLNSVSKTVTLNTKGTINY